MPSRTILIWSKFPRPHNVYIIEGPAVPTRCHVRTHFYSLHMWVCVCKCVLCCGCGRVVCIHFIIILCRCTHQITVNICAVHPKKLQKYITPSCMCTHSTYGSNSRLFWTEEMYVQICISVFTYIFMHTLIYTYNIHMYMHMHIHVYMHTYTYRFMCIYLNIYTYKCEYIYIYTVSPSPATCMTARGIVSLCVYWTRMIMMIIFVTLQAVQIF